MFWEKITKFSFFAASFFPFLCSCIGSVNCMFMFSVFASKPMLSLFLNVLRDTIINEDEILIFIDFKTFFSRFDWKLLHGGRRHGTVSSWMSNSIKFTEKMTTHVAKSKWNQKPQANRMRIFAIWRKWELMAFAWPRRGGKSTRNTKGQSFQVDELQSEMDPVSRSISFKFVYFERDASLFKGVICLWFSST